MNLLRTFKAGNHKQKHTSYIEQQIVECFFKGNDLIARVQNMPINIVRGGKVCIAALLTQHIHFYFNVFGCIHHLAPSAGSSPECLIQPR